MTNNCNGVERNIDAMIGEMSLFDGMKEEKAVSLLEREEDSCQLKEQLLPKDFQPLYEHQSNSHQNPSKEETEDLHEQHENELIALRNRLDSLRKRRRRIQQAARIECINQQELLLKRLNTRRRQRNQVVDDYLSVWKGRDTIAMFLDCAKRWNVLNDCFSIWIDGKSAFATINGCRLGAEAASLPSELLIAGRGKPEPRRSGKWVTSARSNAITNATGQNTNSPPRRKILGLFGSSENANNASNPLEKTSVIPTILEPVRVPWLEINAALGHACLLLKILQESSSKKGGDGVKFSHELHPMGATSKIGIRFGSANSGAGVLVAAAGLGSILSNGNSNHNEHGTAILTSSPVIYNLFFEEASGFSFFKNNNRNFNWALQAFLQCIAEAAAQQADKTIAVPHVIRHKKASGSNNNDNLSIDNSSNYLNGGEWTIGGLSICYPSVVGEGGNGSNATKNASPSATSTAALEWTRACRFLLTDLKWLVAYGAKHIDR